MFDLCIYDLWKWYEWAPMAMKLTKSITQTMQTTHQTDTSTSQFQNITQTEPKSQTKHLCFAWYPMWWDEENSWTY